MTNDIKKQKAKAIKFINAYRKLEPDVQKKIEVVQIEMIYAQDIERKTNLNNYKGFLIDMIREIDNIDSLKTIYKFMMKHFIYD